MIINISNGSKVVVDADKFEYLNRYNWHDNGNGYVFRTEKGKRIYMHRELMSARKGQYVDHINLDRKDNRVSNLRICTNAQNARNQPKRPGTSKFKGVYFDRRKKIWVAQITHNYQNRKLGNYLSEKEAALAYNFAAMYFFGSFARLNGVAV